MIHRLIIPGIIAGALHGAFFLIPGTPPLPPPAKADETKQVVFVMPVIPIIPPDNNGDGDRNEEDRPDVRLPPLLPPTPSPAIDNGPTEPFVIDPPRQNVDWSATSVILGDYTKRSIEHNRDRFKDLIDSSKLDKKPGTVFQVAPEYPPEAKRNGLSGDVTVTFTVDENGDVHGARVTGTSNEVFNDAAVRAVSRWRFEPGRHLGRRVAFKMSVPIVFNLNEQD